MVKKKDQEMREPERAATSALDHLAVLRIDAVFGRSERAVQST
jgi:hypothetical protein